MRERYTQKIGRDGYSDKIDHQSNIIGFENSENKPINTEIGFGSVRRRDYLSVRPEPIPGQVLDVSEIQVGKKYIPIYGDAEGIPFTVLAEPYGSEYGSLRVKVEQRFGSISHQEVRYLTDCGVQPYMDRDRFVGWSPTNRLVKDGKLWMTVWNNFDFLVSADGEVSEEIVGQSTDGARRVRAAQVISPKEIVVGNSYKARHEGQDERDYSFTVVSEPRREKARQVVEIERQLGTDGEKVRTTLDLGDYGVVPRYEVWTALEFPEIDK